MADEDVFDTSSPQQQKVSNNDYIASTFVKDSVSGTPKYFSSDSISLALENDDIAFVLGYRGQTKQKIANVSKAKIEVDQHNFTLTITGTLQQRTRAQEYVDMILGQRRNSVLVDLNQARDDLTVVFVPEDCVGYVTGKKGIALRNLETEWDTLMFFTSSSTPFPHPEGVKTEILAIFGPKRSRLGAALKVMSAVEQKHKGYYPDLVGDLKKDLDTMDSGYYYETQLLDELEFRYALGSLGATRKKLAKASGCILEYIGYHAIFIGTKEERNRAKDYMRWLLLQRQGGAGQQEKVRCDVDIENRDDITVLKLDAKYVGWVTGMKGKNLRAIEEETGVYLFCFSGRTISEEARGVPPLSQERILIFSQDKLSRQRAFEKIHQSVEDKKEADASGGGGYGRSSFHEISRHREEGNGGSSRGRSRRSPSPPPRRQQRRPDSPNANYYSRSTRREDSPSRSTTRREDSPSRSTMRREDSTRREEFSRRGTRREDHSPSPPPPRRMRREEHQQPPPPALPPPQLQSRRRGGEEDDRRGSSQHHSYRRRSSRRE